MDPLRIAVVTNLYPPASVGGYEIGCERIVGQLQDRGHIVDVLTSRWHTATAPASAHVTRALPISARDEGDMGLSADDPGGASRLLREFVSQRAATRWLDAHAPDVVYAFNMRFISRSVLALAAQRAPLVLYVSDPWFADHRLEDQWVGPWERLHGVRRAATLIVDAAAARERLASTAVAGLQFTSAALRDAARDAGRNVLGAEVVHWGVDPARFASTPRRGAARRFLFVGQVLAHKGVATAVRAFADLCDRRPDFDGTFTIAGDSTWPPFVAELQALATQRGVRDRVHFTGRVAPDAMPALYAEHDALVFPSEWDEPFSITLVEAMAAGLPVVSTLTGGSGEIVVSDANALTFPAGDAAACSAQLERLLDPATAARLGAAARQTVADRFTLARMVDAIETSLEAAVATRARSA